MTTVLNRKWYDPVKKFLKAWMNNLIPVLLILGTALALAGAMFGIATIMHAIINAGLTIPQKLFTGILVLVGVAATATALVIVKEVLFD